MLKVIFISLANVKEHAPLSAGASVDHGVDVGITEDHVNRAADRGCCVSTCSASSIWISASGSDFLETSPAIEPMPCISREQQDTKGFASWAV